VLRFTRWAILTLSFSLLLFVAAGNVYLPSLARFLGIFSAFLLAAMLSVDPGLMEERSHSFEKHPTSGRIAAGLWFLATPTLAALDIGRLHWFDSFSEEARMGGLLVFVTGTGLQRWAMASNPFFSPEIRLQTERGHRLITSGPYRWLRHPGYLGMLISVPAMALAIGSWLGLIPAAIFCLVIRQRVADEETFLRKNLAGYSDFTRQVTGRLFPRFVGKRSTKAPVR
jgi:protein-S-isoprenylcysteine O-methyltransferase Ste14